MHMLMVSLQNTIAFDIPPPLFFVGHIQHKSHINLRSISQFQIENWPAELGRRLFVPIQACWVIKFKVCPLQVFQSQTAQLLHGAMYIHLLHTTYLLTYNLFQSNIRNHFGRFRRIYWHEAVIKAYTVLVPASIKTQWILTNSWLIIRKIKAHTPKNGVIMKYSNANSILSIQYRLQYFSQRYFSDTIHQSH